MTKQAELVPEEPRGVQPAGEASVHTLLQTAIDKGADAATLERLVALYERLDDRRAERALAEALSSFQHECPSVAKNSTASVTTRSGGDYHYDYAELDDIVSTVREPLAAHGLSYTWDSDHNDKGFLVCTCTVRHSGGARLSARFTTPTGAKTNAMSAQQEQAAALTYARRQSLMQVLGLATCDADLDGAEVAARAEPGLTEDQVVALEGWLMVSDRLDRKAFLRWLRVDRLEDIPQSRYGEAVDGVKKKLESLGEDVG